MEPRYDDKRQQGGKVSGFMADVKRTALVTGGNRGLGAAIARALHNAGHAVIINSYTG